MILPRLGALTLLAVIGCTSTGETCVGGIALDGGECIARCDPAACVVDADGGTVLGEDGLPVNACVNNICMLRCDSHRDCTLGTESCLPAVEDARGDGGATAVNVCQPSGHPDGLLAPCPFDEECVEGLDCIEWSADGDTDAYCSKSDCLSDDDCAPGLYCGVLRDPHEICGTTKGDNALCGETNGSCIEAAELSEDGPLFEGSQCILRRTCLQRGPCAPCATDLDCSYTGTDCIDIGGESRCAASCKEDTDCTLDRECEDDHCVPRFGKCSGEGRGLCEPCVDDRDCGDATDSTWACYEIQVGQNACFDYQIACTSNDDCVTPVGAAPAGCLPSPLVGCNPSLCDPPAPCILVTDGIGQTFEVCDYPRLCAPAHDFETNFDTCW